MSRRCEAVVFDMDGVLIDSEPYWQEAEIEVFARHGLTLTPAQTQETIGLRIDEVVAYWEARRPAWQVDRPTVAAEIVDAVAARVRERGTPLPGVHEAIAAIRGAGVRLALATSSAPALIDAVCDRLGLTDTFEARCSASFEAFGKPHPAVYLRAADAIGVAPDACLAIEDSVNGMIAAKAARMRCLVVPEPTQRNDRRFGLADATADSLLEVDWATLLG